MASAGAAVMDADAISRSLTLPGGRAIPAILAEFGEQLITVAAIAAGHACLVYDVPLLVESGERWRRQVDLVCVVDCEVETQIQRVMSRNQLGRTEIERIISQQASRQQRLGCADAVIFNEGIDLAHLKQLVHEMMARFGL